MSRLRVWIAFVLLSLAWGSSYLFIRIGLRQLSPVSLVAMRLFIATIGILAIDVARRQNLRIPWRGVFMIAIMSAFSTSIPFLLISWGEETVPSGLAAVLNSTVPIFSVLLAGLVLQDEPITLPRIGGVVVGFAGILLLISGDLTHNGVHWTSILGQIAIVGASACYAIGAVLVRKTLRGISATTIATYALGITAVETGLISLIFSRPPLTSLHSSSLGAVIWLGLVGSALGYILYYVIIENWGASRGTLVTYMLPPVGLALGVIFLGEALTWRILAGSALVILGVVLAGLVRSRPHAIEESTDQAHNEEKAATG
jgi:drug/metabolite transporter (DMT)-like permease